MASGLPNPYRTSQVLSSFNDPTQSVGVARPNAFPTPKGGWPDLTGLHELQSSRQSALSHRSIEAALRAYRSGLPKNVQDRVDVAAPRLNDLWVEGPSGEAYLMDKLLPQENTKMYERLRETPYTIWAIQTNHRHWVTVIMGKALDTREDMATKWTWIRQLAVVDPLRDAGAAGRLRMIHRRLRILLETGGQFHFDQGYECTVWAPNQPEVNSDGPMCYWVGKSMMNRLLELYERNLWVHESMWNDLSGWFNEAHQRAEMIGWNAWEGLKRIDYNGRVSLELVNKVGVDDGRGNKIWHDISDRMRPSSNEPESEPVPRPNFWDLPDQQTDQHSTSVQELEEIVLKAMPHKYKVAPTWSPKDYISHETQTRPDNRGAVWPRRTRNRNPWLRLASYGRTPLGTSRNAT
ncbi:hypothetical protein F5Y15DRAFT_427762 [Xylariaceae sp. FL0016]|nr:hypothetical protein F5Y15DRAFT_427762 [Xylariaceae sp. FL0016]